MEKVDIRTRKQHPVRIAVQFQPQHATYSDIRRAVHRAERLGVDAIFTWDHMTPVYGDPDGPSFECWATLAAWAEQTSSVQIGPMVSCVNFRNPRMLGYLARTTSDICGGRLLLGLGAGWLDTDFTELGRPVTGSGARIDALAEALATITATMHRHGSGESGTIPLMIGGTGPNKTMPLVARYADVWHSFSTEEELPARLDRLHECCAEQGRDPDEIEIAVAVGGGNRSWRLPRAPQRWGEPLRRLGASLFTLSVGGPEYDLTQVGAWLRWRDAHNGSPPVTAPIDDTQHSRQ